MIGSNVGLSATSVPRAVSMGPSGPVQTIHCLTSPNLSHYYCYWSVSHYQFLVILSSSFLDSRGCRSLRGPGALRRHQLEIGENVQGTWRVLPRQGCQNFARAPEGHPGSGPPCALLKLKFPLAVTYCHCYQEQYCSVLTQRCWNQARSRSSVVGSAAASVSWALMACASSRI
jgi:hypothetical protein